MKKKKIIFFEVRNKTKLYLEIAKKLSDLSDEYEIYWVVQNPCFMPTRYVGTVVRLPYPKYLSDFNGLDYIDLRVLRGDRFFIHYKNEPWYYQGYRKEIKNIIEKIDPDYIFGELGNFVTHYAALMAKEMGFCFYDVEAARYPNGCFGVYKYDRWDPLQLRVVDQELVDSFIDNFINKKPIPDYMIPKEGGISVSERFAIFENKLRVLWGYIRGDIFCTQNPVLNFLKKKDVIKKLSVWDSVSSSLVEINNNKKIALYPLQMQPEFNFEVWGGGGLSQQQIIENLSANLPDDWCLVIKSNPKSYFELIDLKILEMKSRGNVYFLDRSISMNEINPVSDIVVTVTGTVQIERLLRGERVYIIGETPFSRHSCIKKSLDELQPEDFDKAIRLSPEEDLPYRVARYLLEHSAEGMIAEPYLRPDCLLSGNVEMVAQTLHKVMRG